MNKTELGADSAILELLDFDASVPCDGMLWSDGRMECGTRPAEWKLTLSCCPFIRLYCTRCKNIQLSEPYLTHFRSPRDKEGCGQIFIPGSSAYSLVEKL